MAKSTGKFDFSKLTSVVEDISKKTAIMIEKDNKQTSFIDTGIYTFNALLSKNIRTGGISKNRITVLAGPPQCGKSYLCYNIARNAQKEGYNIIYIDTEFSIEKHEMEKFGINISEDRLMLIRSNKVEDLKIMLTQLLDNLKTQKQDGVDIGKTIIFLDSIGQLASNKEVEDALGGKIKVDMSRAKAIKSLLRIINSDLGYLDIPLVATNHVYMTQDLYPVAVMGGGEGITYTASTVVYMSIAKLKTGEENKDYKMYVSDIGQSGVIVTAKSRKNRLAKPMKIKFEINHNEGTNPYRGLEVFCTPENFDKVGIAKVKKVESGRGKAKTIEYQAGGTKYYVKHLDQSFYEKSLFNGKIFTDEVITALEPIVQTYFEYSSYDEQQKIMDNLDSEHAKFESDTDFDIDGDNDGQLFDK